MSDDSASAGPRQLTVVLGVHRSGTSLLAAGLAAIGVNLGAIDALAEEDNPKGYFEHPAIREFNDRLMQHIGVSWDNWGFYSPSEDFAGQHFDDWRHGAALLLQQCFDGPGHWGLKEPRMTTLLPFWNAVVSQLGWSCKRILILRHPDEVAESQRQRFLRQPEKFRVIAEPEPMYALWAVTMHAALTSLPDDDTFLVRHEQLYADPKGTLEACADFLEIAPQPQRLKDFAADFFDPALQRAAATAKATGGAWGDVARHFYADCAAVPTPGRITRLQAIALAGQQHSLTFQLPFLRAARHSISRLGEAQSSASPRAFDIYIPEYETIRRALGLDSDALQKNEVAIPTAFLKFLFEVILRLGPFSESQYRAANADLADAERDKRIRSLHEHFLKSGWYEGRAPGEYRIDEAWYQNAYEDIALAVREQRLDGVSRHFNKTGRAEGRVGSPEQARWKDLWNRALKSAGSSKES